MKLLLKLSNSCFIKKTNYFIWSILKKIVYFFQIKTVYLIVTCITKTFISTIKVSKLYRRSSGKTEKKNTNKKILFIVLEDLPQDSETLVVLINVL